MPICMFPALMAPDRLQPNYAEQGQYNPSEGVRQGSAVVPGEVIFPSGSNLITGHGTYRDTADASIVTSTQVQGFGRNEDGDEDLSKSGPMRTSLTGLVRIVNKLIFVEPIKARYFGNVGDTVVGRIVEVDQRRWRVDLNAALLGNLALANVKLPGGELRRKSEDDERAMRSFMKEGDLIVAEIREVYKDGSLQLHMPGKRTGKLGGGCLLRIPPSMIKRQKIHRHRLAVPRSDVNDAHQHLQSVSTTGHTTSNVVSIGLILGCNGYVWVGPAQAMDIGLGLAAPTGMDHNANPDSRSECLAERSVVARVRNCILALARNGMPVWETSVLAACEASWLAVDHDPNDVEMNDPDLDSHTYGNKPNSSSHPSIARLLRPDVARRIVMLTQAKLATVNH